jgi:hypothetical protein
MADSQPVSPYTDLLTAISADPPGLLVLRHERAGDELWATVRRADPHVEFTHTLLVNVLAGWELYPELRMQAPDDETSSELHRHDGSVPCSDERCFYGWLLHVDARDRHVVYQIGNYHPAGDSWHAGWPD